MSGCQIFVPAVKKVPLIERSINLFIFLFAVTLVQIWWIAVWGITDIGIRFLAGKHRFVELLIYIFFLVSVATFLEVNPQYMIHL